MHERAATLIYEVHSCKDPLAVVGWKPLDHYTTEELLFWRMISTTRESLTSYKENLGKIYSEKGKRN